MVNTNTDDEHGDHEDRTTKRLSRLREKFRRGSMFLPDAESPPVDDALLRRYLAGSANDAERSRVNQLLLDYRPWVEALRTLESPHDDDLSSEYPSSRSPN